MNLPQSRRRDDRHGPARTRPAQPASAAPCLSFRASSPNYPRKRVGAAASLSADRSNTSPASRAAHCPGSALQACRATRRARHPRTRFAYRAVMAIYCLLPMEYRVRSEASRGATCGGLAGAAGASAGARQVWVAGYSICIGGCAATGLGTGRAGVDASWGTSYGARPRARPGETSGHVQALAGAERRHSPHDDG